MTNGNTNKNIVNIKGREYMTVAGRLEEAHKEGKLEGVRTEILTYIPIIIKATIIIAGNEYTGISSVNMDTATAIEKQNPFEVAETSAVGRALGFAGYGLIESVASADEMVKAGVTNSSEEKTEETTPSMWPTECAICGEPAKERKGISKKNGKAYHGIFCSTEDEAHTMWL